MSDAIIIQDREELIYLLCEAADDLMPQPTTTPVHDIYDQLTMSRADRVVQVFSDAIKR